LGVGECGFARMREEGGDLVHAVEADVLSREDVAEIGDVLLGAAEGRQSDRDITIFDSTGLAIQDLAIALAAMERARTIWTWRSSTYSSSDSHACRGMVELRQAACCVSAFVGDCEQPPFPRDALELIVPAVVEGDA